MTAVLGVDGGQSAIRLRHSSATRIAEVAGISRLEGDDVAAVADAIATGWRDAGFPPADRAVLGLTTAPADSATGARLSASVGSATAIAEVWLADDAVTSHAGALSLGWGVSVVAGTGVACLAVPEAREPRILGGHGFLLGDEGGAFWIGRRGVRAVLRAADGRGETTALTETAERRFGDLGDLHVRLHRVARPVHEIAEFAPEVLAAAADGDVVAGAILDEATDELWSLTRVGAMWAAEGDEVVPLGLGGRLLQPGSELRRRLDDRLGHDPLPVAPRTADASPLDGAILLGLAGDPRRYGDLVRVWRGGSAA